VRGGGGKRRNTLIALTYHIAELHVFLIALVLAPLSPLCAGPLASANDQHPEPFPAWRPLPFLAVRTPTFFSLEPTAFLLKENPLPFLFGTFHRLQQRKYFSIIAFYSALRGRTVWILTSPGPDQALIGSGLLATAFTFSPPA